MALRKFARAAALAGWVLCAAHVVHGAEPRTGDRLQVLMDAAQERHVWTTADTGAPSSDQSLVQYRAFLARGEAALASSDAANALSLFERAAGIQHAAESELGLVRTYMQLGQYRRALAFSAHTAAAHRNTSRGTVLYAWLLRIGGQTSATQRLMDEATLLWPGDAVVHAAALQLRSDAPRAVGALLVPPQRLAPYGTMRGLSSRARVVGTGALVPDGTRVLVPLAAVTPASALWVRNGVGQMARATIERRAVDAGVAVLRLEHPLPADGAVAFATGKVFPGSAAFMTEYMPGADAQPAWPMLSAGFVGPATDEQGGRELNINLAPGPRGGPVFNQYGKIIGIAISKGRRGNRVVVPASLRRLLTDLHLDGATTTGESRMAVEQIYEMSLLHCVQIIAGNDPLPSRFALQ